MQLVRSPSRDNNFDFLRCVLAALVILSHCYVFVNDPATEPLKRLTQGQMASGGLAVAGFFFISGYLIPASWLRSRQVGDYLRKRVLRIYPGFLVCVAVCIALVPIIAGASLSTSYAGLNWLGVLKDALMLNQIQPIPSVTAATGIGSLNGSLWTIKIEFECYLLALLLGFAGILDRRRLFFAGVVFTHVVSCILLLELYQGLPGAQWFARLVPYGAHFDFASHFLAGTTLYLLRDRVPWSTKWLGVAIGVLVVGALSGRLLPALLPFPLGYILLYIAHHPRVQLQGVSRYGDMSYGIYLYGWPVQLLLAAAGAQALHPVAYCLLTLSAVIPLAMLSWHLVEKHALRLKRVRAADRQSGRVELSGVETARGRP